MLGSGTQTNPYRIQTPEDLNAVRNNLSAYYELANDIDMAGFSNFTPIGTSSNPFTGHFDGKGHKILNLTINASTTNVGLFGFVDNGGVVQNVALVPVTTIKDIGPGPWVVIGSNVSDFEKGVLKLLPGDADETAENIKAKIKEVCGKDVEVLIFGDGAYKDPDTGIFELADPYPAIGVSSGLKSVSLRTGTKLKLQVID